MHSPLPDASALEAGILEDEQPSRLSRVQDNVRNLLRNSRFGSVASSPLASPSRAVANHNHGLPTPPQSPTRVNQQRTQPPHPVEEDDDVVVIPSPLTESSTSSSAPSSPEDGEVPAVHFAPAGYRDTLAQMAHQSALFNTRAVAALDHPDLSDPSLAVFARNKAQRGAWKRSRSDRGQARKTYRVAERAGSSQSLLCVLAALLLAAIVATYVVLASTSENVTPTFHILFVLGIILATVVFAHTLIRLFLRSGSSKYSRKVFILSAPRRKHHRHHRTGERRHRQPRIMPAVSDGGETGFVPLTPIRIQAPAEEVRPDTREAEPTATAAVERTPPIDWNKDVDDAVPNPPPAYGIWRGSVRANPDLLHWQAVPSPVDSDTAELPSPTYEEAMLAQRTGPPSYVTRDSPARRTERRDCEGAAQRQSAAVEVVMAPEMVEGHGIGLGM